MERERQEGMKAKRRRVERRLSLLSSISSRSRCLTPSSLLRCKITYVLLLKPQAAPGTPPLKDLGNCFCSVSVILVFAKCLLILCLNPF